MAYTTIGNYCFYSCENLQSVVIGDGVKQIDEGAFEYTYRLSSLIIGKSVIKIHDFCFYEAGTKNSDTLKIICRGDPSKIWLGPSSPFKKAKVIAYYPLGSGNPGTSGWGGVSSIQWITYSQWDADQSAPIYAAGLNDKKIIASGYCGTNVQWYLHEDGTMWIFGDGAITSSPWRDSGHSSQIKHVIIDEGVTSICEKAFYCISSIESVAIGNNVTTIGNYCFYSVNHF